jgi:hypothetical protein
MSDRGSRPRQAAKPCTHCNGPHSPAYCLKVDWEAEAKRLEAFSTRAAAHATAAPKASQRWLAGVTDESVAVVLYAIEADHVEFYRDRTGRWHQPQGARYRSSMLSPTINEMIRTGLLRHVIERDVDYLVPALVHLFDHGQSACRFTGEDMGPMRARLVTDLALVDCLECEAAVARGGPRGL